MDYIGYSIVKNKKSVVCKDDSSGGVLIKMNTSYFYSIPKQQQFSVPTWSQQSLLHISQTSSPELYLWSSSFSQENKKTIGIKSNNNFFIAYLIFLRLICYK